MSRTVVITGANRGIGLALVQQCCERGDTVFAVCRQTSTELTKTGATVIDGVDVATVAGVQRLREQLASITVDVLINNAGILREEFLGKMDYQTILEQFQVNALGPLRVTEALVDRLRSGSKVGLITSRMGSVDDNTSGGYYGYRMSKAALNMAGKSLAQDLRGRGIAVALLHPGYVQTEMVGFGGDIGPSVAAVRLLGRLDDLTLANTGSFWHSNGELLPW